MDSAAFEKLVSYIYHQRHYVDYGFIAAFTIAIYDYFLTLYSEVTLIWRAPISYTSALYFIVRYLPILSLCLDIPNRLLLGITPERCNWSFPLAIWLLSIGVLLAEVVLLIRTWAVWRQNRWLGIILAIFFLGFIAGVSVTSTKYSHSLKFATPPYKGFRGCFAVAASNVLEVDFLMLIGMDFVLLSLMAISAFKTYRQGSRNEFMTAIHRDGILFYICLLTAAVVNVVIMGTLPTDLEQLVTPVCCALYSVLTCRIVLNIRRVARDASDSYVSTDLHEYYVTDTTILPLDMSHWRAGVFRNDAQVADPEV